MSDGTYGQHVYHLSQDTDGLLLVKQTQGQIVNYNTNTISVERDGCPTKYLSVLDASECGSIQSASKFGLDSSFLYWLLIAAATTSHWHRLQDTPGSVC